MTSGIDREFVDPCFDRKFSDSDGTFCEEDEDEDIDEARSEEKSEVSSSTHVSGNAALQSTPVNGPPPTHESHLPSAIKSLPAYNIENQGIHAGFPKIQRKSIFSRLSSIAERSFNSPRRTKQLPPNFKEEVDEDTDLVDKNNDTIDSIENPSLTTAGDPEKMREAKCECNSCRDALALDTLSDRSSVISCSLASLPQSPQLRRESFGKVPVIEDEDIGTNSLFEEKTVEEKNSRISDGYQRLSKFIHTTVRAGRKSLGRSTMKSSFGSEESSNTVGGRSCRTFHGDESKSSRDSALFSKCLRKLASAVSIHNYGHETRSMKTGTDGGSDYQMSESNNSLMFVLPSPKPGEVEIDQLTVGAQTLARDPALRSVIEELRSIYLSQESVVQQASKALDECSNLKRKQSDSIIFAEQLLNVAWQSYSLAGSELHRLLEGGVFEPQRDRVVFEKIKFKLPAFKKPPQSYFLVLCKSGHRIKSSDLICVTPEEPWLTIENWNGHADDRTQTAGCVFEFNRPDWTILIEVYFICKQRRESIVSLDRFARLIDTRAPPSRHLGSNGSMAYRKSSFALLGQATFSKNNILNKESINLMNSDGCAHFRCPVFVEGKAYLHSSVTYEAYLIVKDFNGRFGSEGQMRTFSARLSDQRLDFFERYDTADEKTEPRQTILLHHIHEEDIAESNDDSTYFYDFTLKLGTSKDSWLHLCTNSREDTDQWVHHLKLALREPRGIDLQSLSTHPDKELAEVEPPANEK